MHKLLVAFALATATLLPTGCSAPRASVRLTPEASAVLAPVHRFVDGFNSGDTQAALAACTDAMSIIDEFPPHEWHGAGALQRWFADYDTDARRKGISDGVVTLDEPRHVDIDGEYAYVVLAANYDFKLRALRSARQAPRSPSHCNAQDRTGASRAGPGPRTRPVPPQRRRSRGRTLAAARARQPMMPACGLML